MSSSQQLILGEGAGGAPAAYQIQRSLRFNSADSAYLNRTPASAGNRKTWTWSGWVKRSTLGGTNPTLFSVQVDANNQDAIRFDTGNELRVYSYQSSAFVYSYKTSAVYRDASAWYHIVVAIDTTNATSADRGIIYVNGQRITNLSLNTAPTQNADGLINTTNAHQIGRNATSEYFDGYMADIHFIDGQALTPSSFGETDTDTGVWKPKAYSGTYGTNGFYLKFADNSGTTSTTLGKDSSGNGNNWTPNNFSVTAGAGNDSLVDTPTPYGTDTGAGGEVRGNYCTLNPLLYMGSGSTKANGNLQFTGGGSGGPPYNYSIYSTFTLNTGKWYWEVDITTVGQAFVGMFNTAIAFNGGSPVTGAGPVVYGYDGKYYNETAGATFGNTFTSGDVIGIAVDFDNNLIWFSKNGTWQASGNPSTGSNGKSFGSGKVWGTGYLESGSSVSASSFYVNFGQRPFAYTAPSGFKALCTQNLPTPTIGATATTQAGKYFNTVLYTGTGSSLGVTGVGFQPDFVWIKGRSGATDHGLYDAVRGVQQQLESNTTTDETTESTGLTAFNTDGFTVGALAQLNTSTATYVAWNWKETATAGFDIVTYTGNGTARTISHNLGVAPNMIIVKARTTASTDQGWPVYHSANTAAPETDYLLLNSTAATADLDTVWNDTAPTSSVFSVGTNALVNANNDTYVAYLFAAVAGYSAFGSYTGNGSSDGTFVYTGFKPAFILVKGYTGTNAGSVNWWIFDGKRPGYNVTSNRLAPNVSDAEYSNASIVDFTSNGFKWRDSSGGWNDSAITYIYAAFAENPFKYSLAR